MYTARIHGPYMAVYTVMCARPVHSRGHGPYTTVYTVQAVITAVTPLCTKAVCVYGLYTAVYMART